MNKKKNFIIPALVCAFCCAGVFIACGEKEQVKTHSQEQWTAAFSGAVDTDYFLFSQTMDTDGLSPSLTVKSVSYAKIGYFERSEAVKNMTAGETAWGVKTETSYLKDGHYYNTNYHQFETVDAGVYEITADSFAQKVNADLFKKTADKFFDLCKNSYGDFKASGSLSSGDGVTARVYTATNISFETAENTAVTLDRIDVFINDADASLYMITAEFMDKDITKTDGTKTKNAFRFSYSHFDAQSFQAPPLRLEGKTFELVSISVDEQGVTPDGYGEWIAKTVADNKGKTITAKADGTLEGDIAVDLGGGDILYVNTMKYTEDFANKATYGDLSVSNAHISGLAESQKVTLTANIEYGYNLGNFTVGDVTYDDVLALKTVQGTLEFTYYFALKAA